MKHIKHPTTLLDCLYNCAPDSGASAEYKQGLVVGMVTTIVASGMKFNDALLEIKRVVETTENGLTWDQVRAVMPESWYCKEL